MSRRRDRTGRPAPRSKGRRPSLEWLESRELLTGYSVTTAADSGTGSLRAAIVAADGDNQAGLDTISFAIPGGGVQVIALKTPLPAITRALSLDGTTESGSTPGGAPRIAIDGTGVAAGGNGLALIGGGGGSVVRGLAIGNFAAGTDGGGGRGILVGDGGKDRFEGNYLGVSTDGITATPNAIGIEVDSPGNTIGGTTPGAPNLISGNSFDGIFLAGPNASGNFVQGNRIGPDVSGQFSLINSQNKAVSGLHGIDVAAPGNIIGGPLAGQGNLISNNIGPDSKSGIGIVLQGNAPGNVIQGNRIGVDSTGRSSVANVFGVYLGNPADPNSKTDQISQETVVGNLISGNYIGITGNATAVLIAGNVIGLDLSGSIAVPNLYAGIVLGASGSTIGGSAANSGNIISGNGSQGTPGIGLSLSGDADVVQGNRVGTNYAVTAAVPNAIGMDLHVTNSTIGGTGQGAGNVISGNSGDGIRLDTNGSDAIQGNVIGALANGSPGNGGSGIDVILAATTPPATTPLALNDTIGGTSPGAANFLFGNAGSGIAVANTYGPAVTGLTIRGNAIGLNGRLGIDLSSTGVAAPGYLHVTSASPVSGGTTTVAGVFHGLPGVAYPIDFFANTTADPSGSGQGQYFLGSATVTPGPGGIVAFTQTLNAPAIGQPIISATSTDPLGNTSEFSANFPATTPPAPADLSIVGSVATPVVTINDLVVFTETVTNNGTSTANDVVLNDGLPASLINATAQTTAGNVAIATNNVLTAVIGQLAPGQSATVTIAANASVVAALQNTAGVSSTTFDPNYVNNQATQSVVVQPVVPPSADLAITEFASSATPQAGSNLTYTITVTNRGPSAATNVKVNDFLPAGVTLLGYFPAQGTVNGNYLAENLGTIASGASATMTILVVPKAAGTITNAANVSGNQYDPFPGNNSTSLSLVAARGTQISLGLTQATPPVGGPNQTQIFTLTVTNAGPDAATGVTLVDTLPSGAAYRASAQSQGGTPTLANGLLFASLGTIAAGGSATVTLVVIPTATGTLVNNAGVVANGVAPIYSTSTISVVNGPSVTGVVGARSISQLIVNFNESLTPASASNKANYRLYDLGTTSRALRPGDRPLTLTSAVYIPQTNGVVLTPSRALVPTHYYYLVVVGSSSSGITDTSGRRLVGLPGGSPGSDFTTTFYADGLPKV